MPPTSVVLRIFFVGSSSKKNESTQMTINCTTNGSLNLRRSSIIGRGLGAVTELGPNSTIRAAASSAVRPSRRDLTAANASSSGACNICAVR